MTEKENRLEAWYFAQKNAAQIFADHIKIGDNIVLCETYEKDVADGYAYVLEKTKSGFDLEQEGRFVADKMDGEWRHYYSNGKLNHTITYQDDVMHGPMVEYHMDGKTVRSKTQHKDGEIDGVWQWFDENGLLELEETYQNGKKHGIKKEYYPGGDTVKEEENYKDDVLDGPYTSFHPDGVTPRVKGAYHAGERDGEWQWFNQKGTPETIESYKDGVANGPNMTYYANGKLAKSGLWQDGKKEGLWKHFREDGSLHFEDVYKGDKIEGVRKEYYGDGTTIHMEETHRAGSCHGPYKNYFMNGKLAAKGQSCDGLMTGVWEYFNEDGSRKEFLVADDGFNEKSEELNRALWWLQLGDNIKEVFNLEKKNRTAEQRAADQMNKIYEKYPQYKLAA